MNIYAIIIFFFIWKRKMIREIEVIDIILLSKDIERNFPFSIFQRGKLLLFFIC